MSSLCRPRSTVWQRSTYRRVHTRPCLRSRSRSCSRSRSRSPIDADREKPAALQAADADSEKRSMHSLLRGVVVLTLAPVMMAGAIVAGVGSIIQETGRLSGAWATFRGEQLKKKRGTRVGGE